VLKQLDFIRLTLPGRPGFIVSQTFGLLTVMRKGYRVVIYVVGAWLALSTISIGSCALKTNTLSRAYAHVKIGDSKHSVVAALGDPSRIENCLESGEQAPSSRCSEILHYSSFPYRWLFAIDTEGKVQAKFQQSRL
jgi:hypothetical protein